MTRIFSRRAALALGGVALLAACDEGQQAFEWKAETPAEKELRESRERLQRTVGEGGLAGAGAGAVIGGLVGGVGGAVRGAEIGRLGGAGAGLYVKQLQEQYASREAQLGQLLNDLRATNARMEASLRALRAVVAETRQRAAQGAPDPTRNQRNTQETAALINAAEGQEEFFVAARSLVLQGNGAGAGGVNSELKRLSQQIGTLKSISQDLAAL